MTLGGTVVDWVGLFGHRVGPVCELGGPVWHCVGLLWTGWACMALGGPVWHRLGPGVDCVGLLWTGWACMALGGSVVDWGGPCMALDGPVMHLNG